ncbi:MAG: hypothetical protein V4685_18140 [Bacteroidota bacterium]
MDRGIQLTFNLLLTLLIKLPVIAFFFKQKKRAPAVTLALVINLVTWIIGTIVWLKLAETAVPASPETKVFDTTQLYIRIGGSIFEAIAYWFFLGRNWKKAVLLSLISNVAIYFAAQYITLPEGFFQKKDNMIR